MGRRLPVEYLWGAAGACTLGVDGPTPRLRRAPPPPCPVLTLHTFGECRISVARAAGAPVALAPNADRLFSLALLLAGEAGRPVPRVLAAAWLWPELDPRRARRCLRQALYRLRAAGAPVGGDADHLRLAPAAVAPTFAAAPSAARLAAEWRAGGLRLGRCLPGWAPGADAFGEWVEGYRGRQEAAARAALAEALAGLGGGAAPTASRRDSYERGPYERSGRGPGAAAVDGPEDRPGNRTDDGCLPPAVVARALLDLDPANAAAARVLAGRDHAGRDPAGRPRDEPRRGPRRDGPPPALPPTLPPALPLVGRAALVAALAERVRAAAAGDGGAVWLDGAPGHGASRLVREVAAVAVRLGAAVERLGPGATAGDEVRNSAGDGDLALARAAVGRLLARPGALGVAPPTLAALGRFAADAAAAGRIGAGTAAERLLARRVADLVAAVAGERPVVLAVEGARAADGRSLTLLARAARGSAALVVWAGGPPGAPPWADPYPVPRLAAADAAALARAAAASVRASLSDDDAARCAAAGAGAPRLVVALARRRAARRGYRPASVSASAGAPPWYSLSLR